MSESLEDRLARIGAEAEAGETDQSDRPLPANVDVSRPGRARSKVLQVRLNPDEFDALEAIAARRELPVSTVAREQLLKLVAELREPAPGSLVAQVGAIVELAQSLQETIRSQPPGPLTMASEMAEAYTIPPGMSKDDQHTD